MDEFRGKAWFGFFAAFTGIVHSAVVGPTFGDGLLVGFGVFGTLSEWYRIKWQDLEKGETSEPESR